ncbi:MAG: DNA-directed RNA polymerase subunit beta' [Candidatus Poribacteria bacterium]|nr:DNA-directed RNA polymerase subunit beta' [Candidatus Poribacteria bacterium]
MNTAFDSISIKIASPDQIKDEAKQTSCRRRNPTQATDGPFICPEKGTCSCGEVKKAETINYRSFRPEPEGLFCEAIFGPQKDWECNCGKYKRIKHKGMICDRCGVEITQQRVRRDRLGYIQLAAPVSHIWYFKGIPSRIGTFCELSSRDVERVLYFEGFIVVEVTDPDCPLEPGQVLTEIEYIEHSNKYWGGFRAGTGAEVIREILSGIDLEEEKKKLTEALEETTSHQKKLKIAKQLKQMADFAEVGQRPEWMILDVIPVIPPDLRPLVPLEGGRFATSDLNDLYRRVINRNNRLRKLIQLRSPEVILRNEKRMLQEAVDAFFDNGRHGRRVTGPGNRPLKSLADVLKGKIGRFRQNLLGKRVDYSGRSVIVVGPELGLHQCGIPKRMAVELFKPFIIERLQAYGYTQTIKRAKHIAEHVDSNSPVWEVVEEVIADHPVLLNRPPTLHRLGIQAFLPVLVEGKSIRIPPLVCKAFNADFDGDQMAVHVPLTVEAQAEAKLLMLSSHNILKPSHGDPVTVPELDMVLGPSFLTKVLPEHSTDAALLHDAYTTRDPAAFEALREKSWFHRHYAHPEEVLTAHAAGQLKLHDSIQLFCAPNGNGKTTEPILTTVGRVIFNEVLPSELEWEDEHSEQHIPFFNAEAGGRQLSTLIHRCFNELGTRATTEVLEKVQKLAFEYATLSGISPGIMDYITPDNRDQLVNDAQEQIDFLLDSVATTERDEHENEQIRIWLDAITEVENEMFKTLPELETSLVERGDPRKIHPYVNPDGSEISDRKVEGFSPVHIMADSGARARKNPFTQISAIIGLKAKQSGEILIPPITSSYREGLDVLDYFNSTYGSRKGLVDTAMKTAASGYLTRKLVDVAQDVRVTVEDCGTLNSIQKFATEGGDLAFKISGRTAAEDIVNPANGEILVPAGAIISTQNADKIDELDVRVVKVRSVLTCQADEGVCAKCYGNDLTMNDLVNVGEAVGIIAAQSIGEPGTQLTMRTFHTGGAVEDVAEAQPDRILSKVSGTVRFRDFQPERTVKKMEDLWVAVENKISLDDPAYKVTQVNRSDCPLRVDEFLSQKQFKENAERYKGFDSKACQYEVTTVLDSRSDWNVGDLLSQTEYANAQKKWNFQDFVKKRLRVTQVHHTNISVDIGDLLTEEEAQLLRKDIQLGFDGKLLSRDSRTGELFSEERLTDVDVSSSTEPTSDRDAHFERVYQVTESTRSDFPFKAGETVPAEAVAPWLTPFDSESIYIMDTEVTINKASGSVKFSSGQELTEKVYEDARLEYKAFEVKKLDAMLHEVTAVHNPECPLIVGKDMLTTKAEVDKEYQRILEIDERLTYCVTRVHHLECDLERGEWLMGSEILDLCVDYPAFTATAEDFKVEQFYRISAVNHPDCPLKVNDLLTQRESSKVLRQYKGFEVEVYYKVTHVGDDSTSVSVGQSLTETEYNAQRNEEFALKVTKLYRVVKVHHPKLELEEGAELTAEENRKYESDFAGINIERVYSIVADTRKVDKPFTAGDIITEEQYRDVQEEKRTVNYTVSDVYHPNCLHKTGDVLSEEEYFETIAQSFGFEIRKLTLEEVHKQFPGFNVDELKHRVDDVHHPACPLKQDDLLTISDKNRFSAKYPGIEVNTVETTAQGIEAERYYRVTSVNHPDCPLEVGGLLTQKESSANRRNYKGFEVARHYEVTHIEDGTTALSVGQRLTEIEYKAHRKTDPTIAEKVTSLYHVVSVHHPELGLEVGAELTDKEYKTYHRQFKGFDVELVYRVVEDKRDIDEQLEPGTILTSKEYRVIEKANLWVTHTVTNVYHPNCQYTVGDELSEEDYNNEVKRYPGFEVDELALQMRIKVETADGKSEKHNISPGYSFSLTEGDNIRKGETLAELQERTKNDDIVAGIPRVTELFEARRPKREVAAQIAEIEGYVQSAGTKSGIPTYRIEHEGYESRLYQIPDEKRKRHVAEGNWVNAGEPLTDGYLNPHDILSIGRTTIEGVSVEGEEAVWAYLVDEVQKVYPNGTINDKHVETIVRQMLTKIRITDPGDTNFYPNDEVQRRQFERINSEIVENGGIPATGEPILQSISKASLSTDSFISAASFQQTTKVLTDAAVGGQTDRLFGLKENVILGRLIPAGSGFSGFQNLEVSAAESEVAEADDD